MPTILQKVRTPLAAKVLGIVERAIETKSIKVIKEYLKQLEAYLGALEKSIEQTKKNISVLKRHHDKFLEKLKEQDPNFKPEMPYVKREFRLLTREELLAPDDNQGFNTIGELAEEYYEQWQAQEEQLQDMQAVQEHLKQRLSYVQWVRDAVQPIIDGDETLSDDVLESLHTEADVENVRYHTWQAERQKRLNQIEADIRRVDLELEERKRRLLGKNRDDDK